MKVLLVAGILLSCAHFATPTALSRSKRDEPSEDDKEKLVEVVNNARRKLAKAFKISNMRKVEYDDDLEVADLCSNEMPQDVKAQIEEFERKQSLKNFLDILDTAGEYTFLGCFSPGKTTIGCLHKICAGTNIVMENCVCGGGSESRKTGDPGSECDGGEDDGLCENSGSNLSTIGAILNFIAFYLVASFL
ncbi:unnamed protein product [Caenorhabditis nigoni]